MKKLFAIVGIIVAVLVIAALCVPFFINVDSFRPKLEQSLSASLNRQVQIGKLDASIFSGGASASNIVISDDPAFNKGPFLKASSLKVGLRLMPLIFSRTLSVTGITVENPDIVLLRNAAGKWNYSTMGSSSSKPQQQTSDKSLPQISVDKFQIVNGKVHVGQSSGRKAGQEHVYNNVNLTARNISLTSVMPFTMTADTPGGGALALDGQAGPLNREDSARTPLDATIKLEHADLAKTGFLDPSSGLAGILDFSGKLKSDGTTLHSDGNAKATRLRVIKGPGEAKAPVTIDYKTNYGLESQTGTLETALHTGNSTTTAGGSINAKGEDTTANLKIQGKNMAVNDVEALLPAFGVVLPSGASLQGGVINLDMNAQGPLDRLVITGPLNVSQTHLTGFDLAQKLGALSSFAGIKSSPDTLIQTVSSALRVAPEGIRADNILVDVPSMGSLTGNGVIGANNALDFKMLLKLASGAGSVLGKLTSVSGSVQNKGIPFLIQGTTSNPRFLPALGNQLKSTVGTGLLNAIQGSKGGQAEQKPDLKGILGGLLNKKKPAPSPSPK
ncbi:MAG TPA: AsmA family protein [Terriglobales bacterium]|nr:AsmA family protein [Terriglobales bacterium]